MLNLLTNRLFPTDDPNLHLLRAQLNLLELRQTYAALPAGNMRRTEVYRLARGIYLHNALTERRAIALSQEN